MATPAASGKSLCYHLPVLDSILADKGTRALYIYPTKALAQDQLKGLRELGEWLDFKAYIFDGDTPSHERPAIKRSAQILLTNPDMLHLGILPNHGTWSRFLQGLRYVVLDESHILQGSLRFPCSQPDSPTPASLPELRQLPPVHTLIGHHSQPGRAGGRA